MSIHLVYYPGGEIPTAPQRNRAQLWDGTAATYTEWALDGTVITTRPLTAEEVAGLASQDTAATGDTNKATLQQQARTALTANVQDVTQDGTVQSGAATIAASTGTLTTAQLSSYVRQLAQGLSLLAQNDVNSKKELNALIRLVLGQFDGTT